MSIKPIETRYNGYRFRSRLEARWAVFWDALGIDYEYEKEGFDLLGIRYLPDFWLATVQMWGEVKPGYPSKDEKYLICQLANVTGYSVLMLSGTPENRPYIGVAPDGGEYEYCLTNYHHYPQNERRFYASPGGMDDRTWNDTAIAVEAARSARFEFLRKTKARNVRGLAVLPYHAIEMGVYDE